MLRIASASLSGIARDQRTACARRWLGFSEDVNPVVDLFFEFVFVDEAIDLDGAEEVAKPSSSLPARSDDELSESPGSYHLDFGD